MLNVSFEYVFELGMGSPFIKSEIKFEGEEWHPSFLLKACFAHQVISKSDDLLALIKWEVKMPKGPAFRLIVIDTKKQKVYQSERIEDGPEAIELMGPHLVKVHFYRYATPPQSREVEVKEEITSL